MRTFFTSVRASRKTRQCAHCYRFIYKGNPYVRAFPIGLDLYGGPGSFIYCPSCHAEFLAERERAELRRFECMNRMYGTQTAKGMRVTVEGKPGRILTCSGSHIQVEFDNGRKGWCHPTWEIEYFPEQMEVSA